MRDAGYTRRPTLREMAEPAEPCNKSCAPGYCYCEPIIQPEIKGHNVKPPPEAQTEAEKIAYCAGWWAAMEAKRGQNPQEKLLPWKGLTEEEHNYYKALGFVGVKAAEEKLRAKNSTLACHQGEEGK
jgi:hypothetical protein